MQETRSTTLKNTWFYPENNILTDLSCFQTELALKREINA